MSVSPIENEVSKFVSESSILINASPFLLQMLLPVCRLAQPMAEEVCRGVGLGGGGRILKPRKMG